MEKSLEQGVLSTALRLLQGWTHKSLPGDLAIDLLYLRRDLEGKLKPYFDVMNEIATELKIPPGSVDPKQYPEFYRKMDPHNTKKLAFQFTPLKNGSVSKINGVSIGEAELLLLFEEEKPQ